MCWSHFEQKVRFHKTMKTKLFAVTIIAGFSVTFAQSEAPKITEQTIKDDLARVVCKDKDRGEAVKQLFVSKGAKPDDVVTVDYKKVQNIAVTKKGKSDETIIVGAHYDKVSEGCGAIDNWTGIVILANLYSVFSTIDAEKTLIFVAFGREEEGLVGSREMAKSIPKEGRPKYCSMLNMDSFGLQYPQVLSNTSNSKMTDLAKELAAEVKMPFAQASLAGAADADSSSFLDVGIPAITFHGLSNRWPEILHSPNDKLEKINSKLVYVGYQWSALFLDRIEQKPCAAFRGK
jgi:Zn-dependent M28 family amino/carboxypeptidase